MYISIDQRAQVLTEALPYIQDYFGKVVVIKYGGNAMIDSAQTRAVMGDILLLTLVGVKVVLVHGGGPEINAMLERIGKKSTFVDGLRVTDEETAEIVQMVLAGKVNKDLVRHINDLGGRSIGLSGVDSRMIEAEVLDERLGFVGEITHVDVRPINDLLEKGYIPVISTIGCDRQGNVYNINADTATARIAGALNAESLILMTDVIGILRDRDDDSSLISVIRADEAPALIEEGIISGGMTPKTKSCMDALAAGVGRVFIIDGRVPHAILIEMLTDKGTGTMFVP